MRRSRSRRVRVCHETTISNADVARALVPAASTVVSRLSARDEHPADSATEIVTSVKRFLSVVSDR